MAESKIATLLQKTMGLKVTSVGTANLERSILRRMKSLAIDDMEMYVEKVRTSTLEMKELIEEVIIPETWFFRDGHPFKAMIDYLETRWLPKHPGDIFTLLSAPCSTGEEPYSLAIALLRAGLPADRFIIHAVDISTRCIARAQEGVYSDHSFRGADLEYRSRYFHHTKKQYRIKKDVRDRVLFHTGNILNRFFMEGLGMFDVIFFRNVLIYFDERSKLQAIGSLNRILADDGILFVGHAEANTLSSSTFIPAPYPHAFAFHKKTSRQEMHDNIGTHTSVEQPLSRSRNPARKKRASPYRRHISAPELPDLDAARRLADMGQLDKAAVICETYLQKCGPIPQAFFLLGLIHDAAGNSDQAEKLLRKALYLDPEHEESLVFLMLLAEKRGLPAEIRSLKQRLKRLQDKKNVLQQNS